MKTINYNDNVEQLLLHISKRRIRTLKHKLNLYNIHTVAQLKGALSPHIPRIDKTQVRIKGFSSSFNKIKKVKKVKTHKDQAIRLKTILEISQTESEKIIDTLQTVNEPVSYFIGKGFRFGLGSLKGKHRSHSSFWENAPKIKIEKGFHLIANYKDMGEVFSQGDRGTCVANACCSLVDYKSILSSSRQFLYHQCKMVDGYKGEEGTFISTALKLLTNKSLYDFGIVSEKKWSYNSRSKSTTHQGPPPEIAFNTTRYFGTDQLISPRKSNLIEDIKYLLNYSVKGKQNPVVVGVTLFESFFSYETKRTGWVTLPLPGEKEVGGHAMLIVGYDDRKNCLLVRNSWGTDWAYSNKEGYQGHAWIPYTYIKKYSHYEGTIFSFGKEQVNVPNEKRLYRRDEIVTNVEKRAAFKEMKINTKHFSKRKNKKPSFGKQLLWVIIIILLFNAYRSKLTNYISTKQYVHDVNTIKLESKKLLDEIILDNK